MRLHFLVEGAAEETLLRLWLPRFLPHGHTFRIIRHRGKGKIPADPSGPPNPKRQGLLDQLPAKLRAYGQELDSATDRIIVLVDLDNNDCYDLKRRMVNLLDHCHPPPTALFRIAIEETEAFYLGDHRGIRLAFPKANLNRTASYIQDSVCGTWEVFRDVIGAHSENKVEWAKRMGEYLTTEWKGSDSNRSLSFQHLCRAILKLVGELVD